MLTYIDEMKLFEIHISKVEKAVRKNRLYFICLEGKEHKVNSVEEYLFLFDCDYIFQFYGI